MPWTSEHSKWLVDTGQRLHTADGKEVHIWEFRHEKDEFVLSAWSKHFRNHYCFDSEIDYWRKGYKYSRGEYLNTINSRVPKIHQGQVFVLATLEKYLLPIFLNTYLNIGFHVHATVTKPFGMNLPKAVI